MSCFRHVFELWIHFRVRSGLVLICALGGSIASCSVHHPLVGMFPGDPADDSTPFEFLLLAPRTISFGAASSTPTSGGGAGAIIVTDPALGAALWLKPDSLAAVPHGTRFSAWPDSSGNANDASNGNPAIQPAYIGDGSGPNGQPGVRFSGPGVGVNFMSGGISATPHKTIYAVVTDNGSPSSCCSGVVALNGGGHNGIVIVNTGGKRRLGLDRHGGTLSYNFDVMNRPTIATGVYGAGFWELYLDGTSRRRENTNRGQSSSSFTLGRRGSGNRFLIGDLFEVLVYSGSHSQAERELTQCYLSGKYGIPVSHDCPRAP